MEIADATKDEIHEDNAPVSTGSYPSEWQEAIDDIGKEPSSETVDPDPDDAAGKTAAAADPVEPKQDTSAGDDVDSAGDGEAASETDASASEGAKADGPSWQQELSLAKEFGIDPRGMKRPEVQAAIVAKQFSRSQEDSRMKDLREQVASRHGVDAADVADFSDFDELQRFDRLLDRQQLSRQRVEAEAEADRASEATRDEQARPAGEKPGQGATAEKPTPIDWAEMEETVEPSLVAAMKAQHEENAVLKSRLDRQDEYLDAQAEQNKAVADAEFYDQFDDIVDSLEHEDLFGKGRAKSLTPEFRERRQALLFSTRGLAGNDGLSKELVERAAWANHPEELLTKRSRKKQAKLEAQSKRRIGGGSRANGKSSFKGELEDDPGLDTLYEKLKQP